MGGLCVGIFSPDATAHADGHPALTYTYSIYKDGENNTSMLNEKESSLHLEKKNDNSYMGFIAFEQNDKSFTYYDDGMHELTSTELEEVIEQINEYRNTPGMWSVYYNKLAG